MNDTAGDFIATAGSATQAGTTGATANAITKATSANTLADTALFEPASGVLSFGGVAASDAALRDTGTELQVVTATQSAYYPLRSSILYSNGDVSANGRVYNAGEYITIYNTATGQFTWYISGSDDTGLGRAAAGVVKVTDGSTGQGALLSKRVITAKTADYTVTAAETGTVFTNTGAAGTVVFTLPASPANGLTYEFHITEAQSVDIKTGTAVLIYANAAATTATTGKLTKNTVGTCIQLTYNGVAWMGTGQSGTWTVS